MEAKPFTQSRAGTSAQSFSILMEEVQEWARPVSGAPEHEQGHRVQQDWPRATPELARNVAASIFWLSQLAEL